MCILWEVLCMRFGFFNVLHCATLQNKEMIAMSKTAVKFSFRCYCSNRIKRAKFTALALWKDICAHQHVKVKAIFCSIKSKTCVQASWLNIDTLFEESNCSKKVENNWLHIKSYLIPTKPNHITQKTLNQSFHSNNSRL